MNNKCVILFLCFLAQNAFGMKPFVGSDLSRKQFSVYGPTIECDFEEKGQFNLSDGPLVVAKNGCSVVPRAGALAVLDFRDRNPKGAFLSPQDTQNNDQIVQAEKSLGWKTGEIQNAWQEKKRLLRNLIFGGLAFSAGFGALAAKVPNDQAKIGFVAFAGLAGFGACLCANDLYQLRKFFRAPSVPRS